MAKTASNMLPLGTKAPDFTLPDTVSLLTKNLNTLKGKQGTVIMFICNHCPFVIHINKVLVEIAHAYKDNGISFIAISSNDVINYPLDAPDKMKFHAEKENYPFPYLYDETQLTAKAYNAACTPDFYLFDANLKLTYRGQLDDSRPGNGVPVNGADLKHAINCLIDGKANTKKQKPSIGCGIKWKERN